MTFNRIQFQRGMSIPQFPGRFGTEPQCVAAVTAARRPGGFRCPRRGSAEHCVVGHGTRKSFQCSSCRHQTSLTAGSLLERTELPLATWFLAIYLTRQAKTCLSALSAMALKRQRGVSHATAWLLHHKINRALAQQDGIRCPSGAVQLDDAYLGGERAGGEAGRGSQNKVPFVAAVSLNDRDHPMCWKLGLVSGFTLIAGQDSRFRCECVAPTATTSSTIATRKSSKTSLTGGSACSRRVHSPTASSCPIASAHAATTSWPPLRRAQAAGAQPGGALHRLRARQCR